MSIGIIGMVIITVPTLLLNYKMVQRSQRVALMTYKAGKMTQVQPKTAVNTTSVTSTISTVSPVLIHDQPYTLTPSGNGYKKFSNAEMSFLMPDGFKEYTPNYSKELLPQTRSFIKDLVEIEITVTKDKLVSGTSNLRTYKLDSQPATEESIVAGAYADQYQISLISTYNQSYYSIVILVPLSDQNEILAHQILDTIVHSFKFTQ